MAFILFSSSADLFAKNKFAITVSNNYEQDVMIYLNWKSESFPYWTKKTTESIKADEQNSIIKAPISGYNLTNIYITPANIILKNQDALGLSNDMFLNLATYINSDSMQPHNNKFFVIEKTNQKSMNTKQLQIRIKGYKSERDYKKELAKTQIIPTEIITA